MWFKKNVKIPIKNKFMIFLLAKKQKEEAVFLLYECFQTGVVKYAY
jgi:hypothetical protein